MKNNERTKFNISPSLFWTISSTIIAVSFSLGMYFGKVLDSKERVECLNDKKELESKSASLNNQLKSQNYKIDSLNKVIKDLLIPPLPLSSNTDTNVVFSNGNLTNGLDMGVNTSEGRHNWVTVSNGVMRMDYPSKQDWGAVYITVGRSSSVEKRKARDYSAYSSLLLELKGEKGAIVEIGLKGSTEPNDGNEAKVTLKLTDEWHTYKIDINKFERLDKTKPDMKNLHVVTEFVFEENKPQTLYVKNIQFQ